MLASEIGDDGRLIKWSDLFSYTNIKTLLASTKLPIPRNLHITAELNGKNGFLIDNYIDEYVNAGHNEDGLIEALAHLLIDLYDWIDRKNLKPEDGKSRIAVTLDYTLKNDAKYQGIMNAIMNKLFIHENTHLSPILEEKASKNAVSARIKEIIQDLRNMVIAYTPITMKDLSHLADSSPKGAMVKGLSLMNPMAKLIMQYLNMIGKKVIGIMAVGEKVFFNLNWYYNEVLRSSPEKINYLRFEKTLLNIEGRYKVDYQGAPFSELKPSTRTKPADINFEDVENLRERFLVVNDIINEIKARLDDAGAPKIDNILQKLNEGQILNNAELNKYQAYLQAIEEELTKQCKSKSVDLMISLLLSAATD